MVKNSIVIDNSDDTGRFSSLEIVNGNPAISYQDDSYKDLKYVRANDADGTEWSFRIMFE